MPKSQNSGFSPRLREVKDNFPMPGIYHFRFKAPLIPGSDREKNAVSVWMDCVDDDQHVGVWRNTIVAKVTRINMEEDDDDFGVRRKQHQQPQQQQHRVPTAQTSNQRSTSQTSRTKSQSAYRHNSAGAEPPAAPTPVVAASDNLLGLDDATRPTHTTPSSAPTSNGSLLDVGNHGEGSLLDMNGPTSYSNNVQDTTSHDDFLGMMSTPMSTTTPAAPVPAPVPTPVRVNPAPSSYGMSRPANGHTAGAKPNKAFETFANKSGPFGGLEWK